MNNQPNNPRHTQDKNGKQPLFTSTDETQKREGGDDSLANASPVDSRADEKVIVNEQVSNKVVNAPSQTGVNASEGKGSDEEIINRP